MKTPELKQYEIDRLEVKLDKLMDVTIEQGVQVALVAEASKNNAKSIERLNGWNKVLVIALITGMFGIITALIAQL